MNKKNYSNRFSEEYNETINLYIKLHKDGSSSTDAQETFDGRSLKFFFNTIKIILEKTKSSSIIDFGCGKAKYYFKEITIKNVKHKNITDFWNIDEYYLYDPGVKKFSKYPAKKSDGVICIDVIEHIPEKDIFIFFDNLFRLANKFIFVVVACYPANKTLPDGRNAHLCIKKPAEWKKIFSELKLKHPLISPYIVCAVEREKFVVGISWFG